MQPLRKNLQSNKEFWKNPFVVVATTALLYLASQVMGAIFALPFIEILPSKNIQYAVILVATFLAFCGFVSIAMQVLGFKWRDIGVKNTKLKNLLLVVPVFIVYGIVSTLLMQLASKFPGFDVNQAQDIGIKAGGLQDMIAAFVMLIVITPLFEELLFRGVLFHGLRKRITFVGSALVTSLLFAVAHGQANAAVDTFVLSMFLCFLVERTKSIWPAVMLHALKNFLAFGVLFLGWFK